MEASYKRDLNHNYLILEAAEEHSADRYEVKMLMENRIEGFLPMSVRFVNQSTFFYYEISSKQSMARVFDGKEMNYEVLRQFLIHFQQLLKKAEEYLIDVKHLLIQPEYLYMNVESHELAVVFHPEHEEEVKDAFRHIAEYILNIVNHQDNKAVILAYQLYKNTGNINYTMQEILTLLQSPEVQEDKIIRECKPIIGYETVPEMEQQGKKNQEQQDKENQQEHQNQEECRKGFSFAEKIMCGIIAILSLLMMITVIIWKQQLILFTYQIFLMILGVGTILNVILILKMVLTRKQQKVQTEDHHYQSVIEQSQRVEFEKPESVKTKTSDIGFYDREQAQYGDTVLLGSTIESERRRLIGKVHGQEIEKHMEHFPYLIGKLGTQVDLELQDAAISRLHARFLEKEGILYLEDMNSKNGTFKNGMPLEANETVRVEVGDEISFAQIHFVYD